MKLRSSTISAVAVALALMGAPLAAQTIETKQYEDGGIYEGTFLNGRQHGTGPIVCPTDTNTRASGSRAKSADRCGAVPERVSL